MSRPLSRLWGRSAIYLVLIAFALFFLMPMYVLIVTAFKPFKDVSVLTMWELPQGLDLGSFATAWGRVSPNFWNSMQITIPTAFISSLIGSLNGYIFSKWKFRYHNVVYTLFFAVTITCGLRGLLWWGIHLRNRAKERAELRAQAEAGKSAEILVPA